jgi:type IX secretion system PorP/SprF family membrane protein
MFRHKKLKLIFLVFCTIGFEAFSELDPYFSQYMYNGIYVNPAFAGYRPYVQAGLFFKKYASSFNAGNSATLLSVDGSILQNRLGAGGLVMYDYSMALTRINSLANLAYKLRMRTGTLSFGMSLGFNQYSFDPSAFKIQDNTDSKISADRRSFVSPDLGAGLYYQGAKFYLGLSSMHLLGKSVTNAAPDQTPVHFYFIAGYNFKISKQWKLVANTLIRYTSDGNYLADLGIQAKYKDIGWAGISGRYPGMISGQVGLKISEWIKTGGHSEVKIGYAYDKNLGSSQNIFNDMHELFLIIDIAPTVNLKKLRNKKVQVSPLFF